MNEEYEKALADLRKAIDGVCSRYVEAQVKLVKAMNGLQEWKAGFDDFAKRMEKLKNKNNVNN